MGSGSALSAGRFVVCVCVCVCCLGGHRHPCLGGHVRLVPSALEHILDGKWICPLCREVCGVVCVCSLGGHMSTCGKPDVWCVCMHDNRNHDSTLSSAV